MSLITTMATLIVFLFSFPGQETMTQIARHLLYATGSRSGFPTKYLTSTPSPPSP